MREKGSGEERDCRSVCVCVQCMCVCVCVCVCAVCAVYV